MTQTIDIVLPKLGESIVGATVVQWLKKVGDRIALDEPLLEVSTDKVNSEIPSPVAGVLKEILVVENDEIEVGALLARIEVGGAVGVSVPVEPTVQHSALRLEEGNDQEEMYSPAVLRLAKTEGISLETLRKIEGTGERGRVTKKDIERFLQTRSENPTERKEEKRCPASAATSSPTFKGNEERIQMTGMRKAIAENMVRSFYEAPHASLVTEADVTEVMQLIAREKERFLQTHGVKLTISSFLIQALAKAIQEFPMLNASLDRETIILKRYVNIGLAVNIDKGLVVPVIKNCHERNLVSIAKAVGDLSSRARSGKLSPDEVAEGTLTLTNFGMTGALIGVPIIRYPEVAIVGAGTIQKRVCVRDDDSFAVRQMMYLTLTFDHRVIDGIYGCEFLAAFKRHLETISIH